MTFRSAIRSNAQPRAPQRYRVQGLSTACAVAATLFGTSGAQAAAAQPQSETIVFVRHGEKPAGGFGQLDCQGLNRALALPAVIAAKFGKPDAIYAPNPSMQKKDGGALYDYVRPLATIEPTAIQFGMPVNTAYGYAQYDALEQALVAPAQNGKLILVAWEHHEIEALVRAVMKQYGGAAATVPVWDNGDFDSIYIVKLDWDTAGGPPRATFVHTQEGLNGRAADCPCAALPDPSGASAAADASAPPPADSQ
jgi:hypothetical protein